MWGEEGVFWRNPATKNVFEIFFSDHFLVKWSLAWNVESQNNCIFPRGIMIIVDSKRVTIETQVFSKDKSLKMLPSTLNSHWYLYFWSLVSSDFDLCLPKTEWVISSCLTPIDQQSIGCNEQNFTIIHNKFKYSITNPFHLLWIMSLFSKISFHPVDFQNCRFFHQNSKIVSNSIEIPNERSYLVFFAAIEWQWVWFEWMAYTES